MLQPALTQPTLTQPTLTHPTLTHPDAASAAAAEPAAESLSLGSAATYGALMAATHTAVEHALTLGAGRLPDAETGARELDGYARFLRYAGNHLRTLMRLAEVRHDSMTGLVHRLNQVHETEPADGRWLHAATVLGTAHDLLSTHLTGVGIPRTAEGREILTGPQTVSACVEVAQLILTAIDGSHELIRRTALAQDKRTVKAVPTQTFTHLHATNRAASLSARAALWDLNNLVHGLPRSTLPGLRPAVHLEAGQTPDFPTSLAALRLLRQYSYHQAHGISPASPTSLRDLALLGARITDPDSVIRSRDREPATALERLQHAHATDQLIQAHRAWTAASAELTTSVRGLGKAPAGYAAAISQLLHADLTPGLRSAIGTALPRMGADAAATISHLAHRGELVTLQRAPLATRHQWRPILPEHATALADQFTTAATATQQAFATLSTSRAQQTGSTSPTGRYRRVELQRPPQVAR